MKYIVAEQELPNAKDFTQWLGGGTLRNESHAGGVNFSPTSKPSYDNKIGSLDSNASMLNGNFLFLNPAFASINAFVNLGFFDLIAQSHKETNVYTVTLEVVDIATKDIIFSTTRDSSDYDTNSLKETLTSSFSISEINTIAQSPIELTPNLLSNPLVAVVHIAKNYNLDQSIEVNLGKVAYGTVFGGFRDLAINKSLGALGLSPMSLAGVVVGALVSLAFDEAIEMALGLDTHFGWGGEIVGIDKFGNPVHEEAKSLSQMASETKKSLGLSYDPFSVNLEDKYGNTVGSTSSYQDGAYDVTASGWNSGSEYSINFDSTNYDVNVSGTYDYSLGGYAEHTDWSNDETGGWGSYDEASGTAVNVNADGTYDVTVNGQTESFDKNGNSLDSSFENTRNDPNAVSDAEFESAERSVDKNDGSGGGCFPADTLIKTINGDKHISLIKAGEYIVNNRGSFKVLAILKYKNKHSIYKYNNLISSGGHTVYIDGKLKLIADIGVKTNIKTNSLYNLVVEKSEPFIANNILVDSSIFTSYYLFNNGYITKDEYLKDQQYTPFYENDFDLALGYRYVGRIWLNIAMSSYIGARTVTYFAKKWISNCDKEDKNNISKFGLWITRLIGRLKR